MKCMKDVAWELVQIEWCGMSEKIYFEVIWSSLGNEEWRVCEENVSEIEDSSRRGRPIARWKDRVQEYMYEKFADIRGSFEQVKRWRVFCPCLALGNVLERSKASKTIDRYIKGVAKTRYLHKCIHMHCLTSLPLSLLRRKDQSLYYIAWGSISQHSWFIMEARGRMQNWYTAPTSK